MRPQRVRLMDVPIIGNSDKKTAKLFVSMGLIGKIGRRYVMPGEGTFRCVWDAWTAAGCPLPAKYAGEGRFEPYRRLKRALRAGGERHPDCMLLEMVELFGGGNPWSLVSKHLGMPTDPSMTRVAELSGSARKRKPRHRGGTLENLLSDLPAATRPAFRAFMELERQPPIRLPSDRHIARVRALEGEAVRVLGSCLLIAGSGDRKAQQTINMWVQQCERYDDLLPHDGDALRPAEVEAGLKAYASGALRPTDKPHPRRRALALYASALNVATDLAVRVLGHEADAVTSLLPARPLSAADLTAGATVELKGLSRGGRDERIEEVTDIVGRLASIMVAVENVVHQTEQMVLACMEAMETASEDLDAGLRVGFVYEGPVVREDGSLGDGDQIVSFRIERESTLLERAHALDPDNVAIRRRMPRLTSAVGRYGEYYTEKDWNRLHVVYEGTRPSIEGGECVEPGLADLFRWGMLESRRRLPAEVEAERRRLHAKHGLPRPHSNVEELLCHHRTRRTVANLVRTSDPSKGAIVVPLVEYYHAICYGRIVARYGIRWGARIGETMQLRLGEDCFRRHVVAGEEELYAALKPKGWLDHGKFGMDDGTLDAIRQVKALSHARWFPDVTNAKGEPWLPDTAFGDVSRRDQLPEAAYILIGPGGALSKAALSFYVQVLLYRVLGVEGGGHKRHGDRYVFATMLGLDGTGYEALGHLLHHRPGSRMPRHYDLSAHVVAVDAARRFNVREDAALIGRICDG